MIAMFKGQYKWLSNFTLCEINYQGTRYASVEHAYMSAKSDDPEWKEQCADPDIKPGKIKYMSREITLLENWHDIRVEVMRECLEQKFTQEPFRTWLLETGDEYLQEGNYWGDSFWGFDMETRQGENLLGKLIMEIRDRLNS
ncbi:MAG: NADAR family protein [Saprospirales bacterium]|nr:NADAR family protein [Saprospirales bacterium]MBK8491956.1 NADAR family protein [Saprospirales bacterium]